VSRVTVTLNSAEREALVKLAVAEMRTPRDQARRILRLELEQRGLLLPPIARDQAAQEVAAR
jgi:hypothetical protein